MPSKNPKPSYAGFILVFAALKIAFNLLAISHFGFHRDELLHLALGDHLDWGYKEVPPFIAVLARIGTILFGNSVAATRIFSTLGGALIIWFTGLIVTEMGGGRFAIALSCLALIFSPAFAASDYLFQPVVFDQLWWVIVVYLIIKYVNTQAIKYLYLLGAAIGIGLLTKYTMGFFAFALLIGLLLTKQRRLLLNRHIWGMILVAFLIFLPNMIWQFTHHLPVVTHMKTLQSSQLDYLKPSDFIVQQLLVNGIALFVWLPGFFCLLFSSQLRKYQFLAFAYIAIFVFLVKMNGKDYYLFGAYPMLFAAGGFIFEQWLKNSGYAVRSAVIALFIIPNLLLFPLVLPFLSINQTLAFIKYTNEKMPFMRFATTWEDHKVHPLTQDYADMFGWDEMAANAAKAYHTLTPEQQKHTIIVADNYGEAGAIHHYAKQYGLPDVVSLDSSFWLWAPDNVTGVQYVVFVDEYENTEKLSQYFESVKKFGSVENPNAREKGVRTNLLINAKPAFYAFYKDEWVSRGQ